MMVDSILYDSAEEFVKAGLAKTEKVVHQRGLFLFLSNAKKKRVKSDNKVFA